MAFQAVAGMLQRSAGNNPRLGVQTYRIGTMHSVVYDVQGGFEDWAYGASHAQDRVSKQCGANENPRFGLRKGGIGYDLSSSKKFCKKQMRFLFIK